MYFVTYNISGAHCEQLPICPGSIECINSQCMIMNATEPETMDARPIILLLLVSNVLATSNSSAEDLQELLNRLGIKTSENACMVPNFSLDLLGFLRLRSGNSISSPPANFIPSRLTNEWVLISGNKIGRGHYIWVNGAPIVFQDWGPGQPITQFATENCMIMWKRDWYDLTCEVHATYFICEQSF
ncbi:hypothetical protein B566_EDAN012345 [Ephemera danica]|nr:hypothetical protein B566_EDAN012345 [Ephemera danica]